MILLDDVRLTLASEAGAVNVLRGVSLQIGKGETVALTGPSGSGKSTLMMVIGGLERASAGSVKVAGFDFAGLGEDALARLRREHVGIVFQSFHLMPAMTALENVALAIAEREGVAHDLLRPAGRHRHVVEEAFALLETLNLADEALRPVDTLAYGRQRLIEIAVALGLAPKVLLLDEPAAGVPSSETGLVAGVVERLPPDIAVLIIDHDMDLVFRLARRITVMVEGRILIEGPPEAIGSDPQVRQVYLGERARG